MSSNVRTRFAPSPTGFLHIGGVRTALFNYLFAKQQNGQFILRLEDTDQERFVAEGIEQIVESLDWLGLAPDEGFWISEGKHQNIEFVQSERHKAGHYQKYANELLEKGLAYRDWSTKEHLDSHREDAKKNRKPFIFRKSMAKLEGSVKNGHVIRLDIAACAESYKSINWTEVARGKLEVSLSTLDDFIIIKSDGFPTYNFANVVDDHEMKISHVMRGDEFIPSTPKHLLLYKALGWNAPEFLHLPVINGTDGKKLSKRTGDTNVLDYKDKGYPPEALLNFLALLGWNDGTTQEIFSTGELIKKFELQQINTSSAVFDQARLDWISGHHIRQMNIDELYKMTQSFWPKEAKSFDNEYKKAVLALVQDRLKYFGELPDLTKFFFVDLPYDEKLLENKQLKKLPTGEITKLLKTAHEELTQSDFSINDLQERLNNLLQKTGQKPGVLFSLIRIATTWAQASPGLADTLHVLGKEKSLERIEKSCDKLG